jgi:large subunit ribosomal protein L15
MKLHDLRPADGSRTSRTRVGRGIAAGKGKTAGRGTKGQKARAGGSIPPWFEGGQTPLHQRIPKLRGFKNRFKIVYEVVNVGAIQAAVERGALGDEPVAGKGKAKAAAQITVNQDLLRAVGLVRSLNKPLKILGNGDLAASLFVVADAFTASARTKIEAAGGSVNVLEIPTSPLRALGLDEADAPTGESTETNEAPAAKPVKAAKPDKAASEAPVAAGIPVAEEAAVKPVKARAPKAAVAEPATDAPDADVPDVAPIAEGSDDAVEPAPGDDA